MSNPNVAQDNVRPGLKAGQAQEFTLIMNLKPGGAEDLRKKLASDSNFASKNQVVIDRVGTIHDFRFTIFDNDTRLLFASTFDGDWDAYINDFAAIIPGLIDVAFGEVDDYPGIKHPKIKDYIVKHQITSTYFYDAYPDTTVRDIRKAMKVKSGLDVLLDAASS
jgi:hypothetical protein